MKAKKWGRDIALPLLPLWALRPVQGCTFFTTARCRAVGLRPNYMPLWSRLYLALRLTTRNSQHLQRSCTTTALQDRNLTCWWTPHFRMLTPAEQIFRFVFTSFPAVLYKYGTEQERARQNGWRNRSLCSDDIVRSTANSPAIKKHTLYNTDCRRTLCERGCWLYERNAISAGHTV